MRTGELEWHEVEHVSAEMVKIERETGNGEKSA